MKILKRIGANIFIVFVLMTMIRTHLPMNTKFFQMIYKPIDAVESSIGTNQTWLMFSPNPSRLDAYVIGEVEYEDGSKDTFDFYKGIGMSMFDKYLHGEKYRKFTSENLRSDKKQFLWPDASKFVLRKLKEKNNYKLPKKVSLIRYWDEIPSWDKKFVKHDEFREQYKSFMFYSKEVL
ncbi:MAG TPA: hypothetical protein VKZ84_01145 [Bacteriovoracaceae bacterium]|nr:hypothetical protein [Bacteriovoracaceae bacterium]